MDKIPNTVENTKINTVESTITNVSKVSDNSNVPGVENVTLENEEKKEGLQMAQDLTEKVNEEGSVELEQRIVVIERRILTDQELEKCRNAVLEAVQWRNLLALDEELNVITIEQRVELLKIQDEDENTALHLFFIDRQKCEETENEIKEMGKLSIGARILSKILDNQDPEELMFETPKEELIKIANQQIEPLNEKDSDVIASFCRSKENEVKKIMKLLLKGLNADQKLEFLKMQDKHGNTVLHLAIISKSEKFIRVLCSGLSEEQKLELLKIQDNGGRTALHRAAANNNKKAVALFFERLNEEQKLELLKIQDNGGRIALHEAAEGSAEEVTRLFFEGLNVKQRVELLNIHNNHRSTALHLAAENKNVEVIRVLLEGLSVEQRVELLMVQDNGGSTALHRAVENEDVAAIGILLEGLSNKQRMDLFTIQDSVKWVSLCKVVLNIE